MDKPALLELSALAPASTGRPGAGTLFFDIHPHQNNGSEIQLSGGWPTEVRNDFNYKAGYAYREVIRLPRIKVAPELRKTSKLNLDSLLSGFDTEIYESRVDRSCKMIYTPQRSC